MKYYYIAVNGAATTIIMTNTATHTTENTSATFKSITAVGQSPFSFPSPLRYPFLRLIPFLSLSSLPLSLSAPLLPLKRESGTVV